MGNTAAARPTLAALEQAGHSFSAALVRAALGETDAAVDTIARIDGWQYWPTFAVRYFFPDVLAPLRADARYEAILRGVDQSWSAATPRRTGSRQQWRGAPRSRPERASRSSRWITCRRVRSTRS